MSDSITGSAAVVVDEAARLSLQVMPLDKVVGSHSKSPGTFSVLTPKRSDPSSSKLDRERYPVPCLKELNKCITGFGKEDYVFESGRKWFEEISLLFFE